MPRLPRSLLLRARSISPFLPVLLKTCRTLSSARNELRWLREYVSSLIQNKVQRSDEARALLLNLCLQRGRGVPLQYLLGSQPFGALDILCRPGVLIPRPETEAYTSHIPKLLEQDPMLANKNGLKILDICSGTGCISLLLYALVSRNYPKVQIMGVDISDKALILAHENVKHNVKQGHLPKQALNQVSFVKRDVLSPIFDPQKLSKEPLEWDIIISNPPYISEMEFCKDTERSVRNWEPKLALVPPSIQGGESKQSKSEDIFYYKILEAAKSENSRIVLMEVGDFAQASRVVQIALDMRYWKSVEIWRDWPDQEPDVSDELQEIVIGHHIIRIRGSGHVRSVLCRRSHQ